MTMGKNDGRSRRISEESKQRDLEHDLCEPGDQLTTNQGVPVTDNQNSLRAGVRGPSLMEDFIFREKMTHFDHESIPERVVHARGSGAHGYFQVYESLTKITRAAVFADPSVKTPVFVRFSTVVGSRGSADTVRDVRGFATKFYTSEGVWDLVGNNIPVFFIQDAMKFPDLVHAIKPEPHNEMPQASAAHDNFWDFASLTPEMMHMIMWVLSDRALPRSYRMMQGFGVHTFRFINEQGVARFVKFHWLPVLGTHSLVWDETQKIAGKDPDFNRRDLWEAIEKGTPVEFELGIQVVDEQDEFKFDFDLLDATKIIPEELVPVRRIGKMTLNRNPDNFFSETEQVAFHVGHVVPGIDFTNDPLLQGRLFSYLDTQLNRFHSANFHELPINRSLAPVHNNQGAGFMRHTIGKGRTNYEPNTLGDGKPADALTLQKGMGFVSHIERIDGHKVRQRSESFGDHFSQATLFWNSMSPAEKQHIVEAGQFELGKVESIAVRRRMIDLFNHVDHELAQRIAAGVGVDSPHAEVRPNHGRRSPALSMELTRKDTAATRQVAILLSDGFRASHVRLIKAELERAGAESKIISSRLGTLRSEDGSESEAIEVDKSYVTTASVLFDATFVPGGAAHVQTLMKQGDAVHWINEMFRHCKPIAAIGEGIDFLAACGVIDVALAQGESEGVVSDHGVVTARHIDTSSAMTGALKDAVTRLTGRGKDESDGVKGGTVNSFADAFISAIAHHRFFNRTSRSMVPA